MINTNLLIITGLALIWACKNAPNEAKPAVVSNPIFEVPSNFPAVQYRFETDQLSQAGFDLGKALFYETALSSDGTIACGECHNQAYAFTHHGHDLSHGIKNREGTRNAPAIQNMAFQKEFFWDGGVFDLDLLPIAPIENPVEMDETFGNVLDKLKKNPKYPPLFQKAYGSPEISSKKFLKALSVFMASLVSANSKYDKYMRKETSGNMSTDELEGLNIFNQKCASCHSGALFTDQSYRNNGLKINKFNDLGRAKITQNGADNYKFKVPSLRNVAVTAPYMHDGRFYTLNAVLQHYSHEILDSPTLDMELKKNQPLGINLSENEKTKIIAFLKTLTDEEFLKDKRFANN